MKNKSWIILVLLSLSGSLFLTRCKKDFDFDKLKPIDWRPDLALPLVNDSISFEKALIQSDQEKNFVIDDNGDISILLYFQNDAFKVTPNDLVKLPAFPFTYEHFITSVEELQIKAGDFIIPAVPFTLNLASSAPDLVIRKFQIKKGKIYIHSNYTFQNAGYMSVTIPDATLNGVTFTQNFGHFTQGAQTDSIDISGLLFDLTAAPNQVTMQVSGLIKQGSQPVAGDQLHCDFEVKISEILKFEGYLGQQTFFPPEESVKITAFHNAYILGNLYFIDPRVSINVLNSIGIPTAVTIEKLWAHNEVDNVSFDITNHLGSNNYFEIPSPAINATKPVSFTMTYTNANTDNSLDEMFNLKPDRVYFKVKTQINPKGQAVNFFNDTNSLFANLKVQLPLFGHFDHLTIQDTFEYNVNKHNEVEYMVFRSKITNGLPLTARMQVYFTDSLFNLLDSLTGPNQILIKEAPVDPATFLPYPGQFGLKDTSFYLDHTRLDNLISARKIMVRAVLNSAENGIPNIKIKAAQFMRINFTAQVKLRKSIKPE